MKNLVISIKLTAPVVIVFLNPKIYGEYKLEDE